MNTDRESAYYAAYKASSIDDALEHEYENGIQVIMEESIAGRYYTSVEALPGVLGNRGIMSFISGKQENTSRKMKGTGEQR